MAATPWEHVLLLAVAVKGTTEGTVEPFSGALTTTVANAEVDDISKRTRRTAETSFTGKSLAWIIVASRHSRVFQLDEQTGNLQPATSQPASEMLSIDNQ